MLIRRHCACKILPFCCRKTCCPDNFLSESTGWKCQWFPARFKSSRKIEMNWNKVWFKFHGDLCSVSGPIKEVCSKNCKSYFHAFYQEDEFFSQVDVLNHWIFFEIYTARKLFIQRWWLNKPLQSSSRKPPTLFSLSFLFRFVEMMQKVWFIKRLICGRRFFISTICFCWI